MSENSVQFNNGTNRAQVNTNLKKLFPYKKDIIPYVYTNSTGSSKTWPAGQVMGVIAATGKVLPCVAAAVDGSAIPVGVLAKDVTVPDGGTINVPIAVSGSEVREDMLAFTGAETLSTTVTIAAGFAMRFREHLITRGIRIVPIVDHTAKDNDLA